MRRFARITGIVLATTGALVLVWVFVVWRWQDPFTGLYTRWEQHQLAQQLQHEFAANPGAKFAADESPAAEARAIRLAAARFRLSAAARGEIFAPSCPGIIASSISPATGRRFSLPSRTSKRSGLATASSWRCHTEPSSTGPFAM